MPTITYDRAAVETAFDETWISRYADLLRRYPDDIGAWRCVVRSCDDVADVRLDGEPAALRLDLTKTGVVLVLETETSVLRAPASPVPGAPPDAAGLVGGMIARLQDAANVLLDD